MPTIRNIIFFILTFFLVVSLSKNILDYKQKMQFFNTYQKELNDEKERNKKLQNEIVKSKDLETREKYIRNKLNLLKNGEVMLILPITPTPIVTPTPLKANWQKWMDLFK